MFERIMKRKSLMKKGIAIATAVFTVFASSSTILAYEPFVWTDKDAVKISDWAEAGTFFDDNKMDDCDFSLSNEFFVYEDGTQIAVNRNDSQYVLCNHVMVNGYYHAHNVNAKLMCHKSAPIHCQELL